MAESSAFVVKAPFTDPSTGDGTQFVVHRLVLTPASQIWNDMFSLPQASEGSSDTPPVIPVEEDPETIDALLTMVYPLPSPQINSYDLATRLVQACDKYFIDVSRLDTILYRVLRTTAALEADPLGVYALAWRLGMDDEAKVASQYTHSLKLNDPKIRSDLIRRSGSVNSLAALWDLQFRREAALDDLTKLAEPNRVRNDPDCNYHSTNYLDFKWTTEDYLRAKSSARQALQKPYPTCYTIEQSFGVSFPGQHSCGGCQASVEAKHTAMVRSIGASLGSYPQAMTS